MEVRYTYFHVELWSPILKNINIKSDFFRYLRLKKKNNEEINESDDQTILNNIKYKITEFVNLLNNFNKDLEIIYNQIENNKYKKKFIKIFKHLININSNWSFIFICLFFIIFKYLLINFRFYYI